MLAIPFRQQLPSIVSKSLDLLVPNIKKDVLGNVSTRNLSDWIEWTDIPYSADNYQPTPFGFITPPPAATSWTVDRGNQEIYRYQIAGLTMKLLLAISQCSTINCTKLRIFMPGGYKVQTGLQGVYEGHAGHATILTGAPPWLTTPLKFQASRTDSNGTALDLFNFGTSELSDTSFQLFLDMTIPLQEWRT